MKKGKNRVGKWGLLLAAALFVGGIFMLFTGEQGAARAQSLGIGTSGNVKLLHDLNASWMMPGEYALEVKEVQGTAMEWVYRRGSEPARVILQLHGGAYTRSLKDNGVTYRRAAVQYAQVSGGAVLTVDYRVAPEYPFPAALEDALLAYEWLLSQGYPPENIIIAGDSAGGGLALATVLYLRDNDRPLPAAVITMSAWTDLNYRRWKPAYVGDHPANHPYISPIYGDYHGFPPLLMQVGGDELLLENTLTVAEKARAAGAAVQQTTYPGMFHVFQMLFPKLPEANGAWEEVAAFIEQVFGGGAE
ncbi:MAG TPA: alpha/beta hydrolase [Limnochordia bacterium]|jgi:monoterpene epsilon-lactone hydrolase|nr:alpha/beta hydrolase [Bacillota bacterium]HOK32707.1 alpha/beta hydrolase [Limnochordia bacterium]HPP72875.1 alpha/beta hydrolase [Limnochordia bacterium]HPT84030.1 alpha/beta hydrolase [Limnochordia bacterium]HPZ80933.1 alpha/beta hydrolase [Limnochordia bacterium]